MNPIRSPRLSVLRLVQCAALAALLALTWAVTNGAEPKAPATPNAPSVHELYGPVPQKVIDAILAYHGLPASIFTVVRRIPLELGGNNARENLMVIAWRDLPDKRQFERIMIAQVNQAKMKVEEARKAVAEWNPAR